MTCHFTTLYIIDLQIAVILQNCALQFYIKDVILMYVFLICVCPIYHIVVYVMKIIKNII